MKAGRTTNIASIIPLLGAFVGAAVIMGLLAAGLVMPTVGAAGAITRTGVDMFDALPSEFTAAALSQQSKILDAKGNVIATPHDENRIIVPLDQVAPVMQKAQIAIEDSRYYEHGGVDVRGVVRALVSNASGAVNTSGGSTLTQQYVKLTLLDTALKAGDTQAAQAAVTQRGLAGITRKLQELKYSIQLEKEQSKDQILQGYLNIVYYGDQAYGVQAAAKHYFNKDAKDLSLPEAALIAGLAQNPGTTDPVNNPDRAIARRNVVLDRMHELGLITDKELADAKAVKLDQMLKVTQAPTACQAAGDKYAYFCDYVIKWLETDPSLEAALGKTVEERKAKIFGGGLTIQTTIDPDLAQKARDEVLARVPKGNSYSIGAAAVTLDPNTGAVKSIAQNTNYINNSKNFGETVVNWAVDTKYGGSGGFQFGSTEKAFALVTALEKGLPISTTVNAKQASASQAASYTNVDFNNDACGVPKGAPAWTVRNDETAGGQMSLTQATARSINTAFVALATQVGVCAIQETETRMGLHRADGNPISKNGPAGIILGAQEVSPMTVASAYGSLASNGVHCTPMPVQSISGPDGKELPFDKPGAKNCQQVVDPEVAHGVANIMTAVLNPGGTAAASRLDGGRVAAGKTGTTDKNNETWFVGYTPQLTTAVWVGTPLGNSQALDNIALPGGPYKVVFGASIAAPTWKAIMNYALAGQPNVGFPAPSDAVANGQKITFNSVSGQSIANATTYLQSLGFNVVVGRRVTSNYRPGVVAYSDKAGTANRGDTITLMISGGAAQPQPQPQPPPPGDGNNGNGNGNGNGGGGPG
ncbi:MAG TPA: transglycosylase domain-containing protein [Lapillicoccus sp.]|nr:transglycosylase domain-containing protein [Lapillicoccus sp.]